MKPLVIHKDSWHYRLTRRLTNIEVTRDIRSICDYLRYFLPALLGATVIGIIAAACLFTYLYSAYVFFFISIKSHQAIPFILLPFFLLLIWLVKKNDERQMRRRIMNRNNKNIVHSKQKGFLGTAYDSLKNKTCVPIVIE